MINNYTDDPGITASELLARINHFYATWTQTGNEIFLIPLSYLGLLDELAQGHRFISRQHIYGIPVLIVSDWDLGDMELLLKSSKRGQEILALYEMPEKGEW